VCKVSSGALEFLPIFTVKFVSKFLEEVKSFKEPYRIISTNIDTEEAGADSKEDEPEEF
jgi:hypothetical protein